MKAFIAILAVCLAAPLAGCASASRSSEREWAAAECGHIIDADARKKCMERVDSDYGRAR